MKYSKIFSLGITAKEFYENAIPKGISKNELQKEIRSELMQTWHGIIDGEMGGGRHCDWKQIFFESLYRNGFIEQTEKGKLRFNDFSKYIKKL